MLQSLNQRYVKIQLKHS